ACQLLRAFVAAALHARRERLRTAFADGVRRHLALGVLDREHLTEGRVALGRRIAQRRRQLDDDVGLARGTRRACLAAGFDAALVVHAGRTGQRAALDRFLDRLDDGRAELRTERGLVVRGVDAARLRDARVLRDLLRR